MRMATPQIRPKPDIVAVDNVNTSFFRGDDTDNDGYPNFIGTSAAAPHVAGAVALMLDANSDLQPADIKSILHSTALDMPNRFGADVDGGFDFDTGFGLMDVNAAVELAMNTTASAAPVLDNEEPPTYTYQPLFSGSGSSSNWTLFVLCCLVAARRRTVPMFTLIGAMAELESSLISERVTLKKNALYLSRESDAAKPELLVR